MMGSLLLAVIYLIFISLGLPDSLLGSGWPSMQIVFDVPVSTARIIQRETDKLSGGIQSA
jgi:hypothetical protein